MSDVVYSSVTCFTFIVTAGLVIAGLVIAGFIVIAASCQVKWMKNNKAS